MGRFDLVSPGAVAGDAVSRYFADLEQRRRQHMVDQLALQREERLAEHDKAATAHQRALLANTEENTQSLIAQRQAAAAAADEKRFVESRMPGDTLSPEDAAKYSHLAVPGVVAQGAQTGVDEQDIPQYEVTQTEATFKGTPAQRKAEETRAAVRNILTGTPELQQHAGIKAALQLAEATGDYSGIYGALANMTKDPNADMKIGTFEDYVVRKFGQNPSAEQIEQARKSYGQADDRPMTPYVWINPGQAPAIIDRGSGTVRNLTTGDGSPVPTQNTAEGANRTAAMGRVNPVLESVAELSERINVNQGVYATAAGAAAKAAAKVNLDDDVAEYEAMVQAFTPLWARALGHVGVLTEQDVQSARKALPAPGDSKSLRDRKLARITKIMSGQAAPEAAPTSPAAGRPTILKVTPVP